MTDIGMQPVAGETLRVLEINPHADPRWKTFVETQHGSLIFHHASWLKLLEAEYGQRVECLACEDANGQLHGVLPLLRTRGLPLGRITPLGGRRLSSLPRTPTAGPLAASGEAAAVLVSGAIQRIGDENGVLLQIKGSSVCLDGLVDGLAKVPWRLTYILELPQSSEVRLQFGDSRNHSAIKRAVNRAAQSGVRVRRAQSVRDLRAWYDLYLETMRWNVLPPRPYRFFRAMWEELAEKNLMCLLLAEQEQPKQTALLGGLILVMFGETVTYLFGARKGTMLNLRPNEALHWQAIHDAYEQGFRYYDFGEVPHEHEGLMQFKRKWGTEPVQLHRYYYPAIAGSSDGSKPGSSASFQRLAETVWRRLPLRATAMIGDRVYGYL